MSRVVLLLIRWCGIAGRVVKRCKVGIRVNVDLASLSGPPDSLDGPWVQASGGGEGEREGGHWMWRAGRLVSVCCASLLCKFSSFLSSLHWPADSGDVTRCSVRRLLGHTNVLIAPFPCLPLLFQNRNSARVSVHCLFGSTGARPLKTTARVHVRGWTRTCCIPPAPKPSPPPHNHIEQVCVTFVA